jgi:hypothetical protein
MAVHDQLALDDVAALAVRLVGPVEADHDDAPVEVDPEVDVVACSVVDAVVDVVPAAMPAPSSAVAIRLAAPAATRDRAAGRRRRGRCGVGDAGCGFMPSIIRRGRSTTGQAAVSRVQERGPRRLTSL